MGIGYAVSTYARYGMVDVKEASPDGLHFFQTELLFDRDLNRKLLERAEKCGFKAIILTVDKVVIGKRIRSQSRITIPMGLK